jgi:hypothetical protein
MLLDVINEIINKTRLNIIYNISSHVIEDAAKQVQLIKDSCSVNDKRLAISSIHKQKLFIDKNCLGAPLIQWHTSDNPDTIIQEIKLTSNYEELAEAYATAKADSILIDFRDNLLNKIQPILNKNPDYAAQILNFVICDRNIEAEILFRWPYKEFTIRTQILYTISNKVLSKNLLEFYDIKYLDGKAIGRATAKNLLERF